MKFELFRLSLFGETGDLTESSSLRTISRAEYLREVFGANVEFTYRGRTYFFVPLSQSDSRYLIGKIGRKTLSRENLSPSEGFAETEHESWKALSVVLDPEEHLDGQKMAVQMDSQVGSPQALVSALMTEINSSNNQRPFSIDAEQIVVTTDFWRFAESHTVTKMTFKFIAPNMMGGTEHLDEELKMLRDEANARNIQLSIQNDEGLILDSTPTKTGVDHASRGTGSFQARSSAGLVFDSRDNVEKSYVGNEEIDWGDLLKSLRDLAERILGRG